MLANVVHVLTIQEILDIGYPVNFKFQGMLSQELLDVDLLQDVMAMFVNVPTKWNIKHTAAITVGY